jgi:putative transposase
MTLYKNKYRVESNRASFWDYSSPGHYFITICIQNRKCILGQVVNGKMVLSANGQLVKTELLKLTQYHKRCLLDEWIIMPNHIHLLIELAGYGYDNGMAVDNIGDVAMDDHNVTGNGGAVDKIHEFYLRSQPPYLPTQSPLLPPQPPLQPQQSPLQSKQPPTGQQIPDMANDIKQYRKLRRNMVIPKILGKFQMLTSKQINIEHQSPGVKNWQNNYYDHVVRDEVSYQRIKQYIINNPAKWGEDKFFEKQ